MQASLIPMGNSPFALRSVVWPRRLNTEVKHHGKRLDSGVRTANEEIQLGGDRDRDRGLNDIVQFMAISAIKEHWHHTLVEMPDGVELPLGQDVSN
jgi:hypothetical protein